MVTHSRGRYLEGWIKCFVIYSLDDVKLGVYGIKERQGKITKVSSISRGRFSTHYALICCSVTQAEGFLLVSTFC